MDGMKVAKLAWRWCGHPHGTSDALFLCAKRVAACRARCPQPVGLSFPEIRRNRLLPDLGNYVGVAIAFIEWSYTKIILDSP